MSWNRQDLEHFDTSTKRALRAARKISERHHFRDGYLPVERLIGVIIDLDPEVNSLSNQVGIESRFFHEASPNNLNRLNLLDHPALLLPRVYETQSADLSEKLRPIHIVRYVLHTGHPGIEGVLGLRMYRNGNIQHQDILRAFSSPQTQLLKAA